MRRRCGARPGPRWSRRPGGPWRRCANGDIDGADGNGAAAVAGTGRAADGLDGWDALFMGTPDAWRARAGPRLRIPGGSFGVGCSGTAHGAATRPYPAARGRKRFTYQDPRADAG
ncbi:hypothetical protein GCM10027091_14130 [Streptomyces daliensis]